MTETVNVTAALKEAMEVNMEELEGYEAKKESTQHLKELLVCEPGKISKEAMQLKAQAKAVEEAITKRKVDTEDLTRAKESLQTQYDAILEEGIVERVNAKKKQLQDAKDLRERSNQQVEEAQAEGKQPHEKQDMGTRYINFLMTRGELLLKLRTQKSHFEILRDQQLAPSFEGSDIQTLMDEVMAKEAYYPKLEMEITHLEQAAKKLSEDGQRNSTETAMVRVAWTEAKEALKAWKGVVSDELNVKAEQDKRVETFLQEQHRLLVWCVDQQSSLKKLSGHDIIEFCDSLHGLVPTMEANITFLSERTSKPKQAHLTNPKVIDGLVDLHNSWVNLQVMSYEMLLKVHLEQHSTGGLKEAVVSFAEWQERDVKQLLDESEELLQTPENPKEKELVKSALVKCKELQDEFQPHLILMNHLADFEVRMGVIDDQYKPMMKTTQSSLTALCQRIKFSAQNVFKGKQEYETDLNSLNQWMVSRDTDTTSWEVAKDRISKISMKMEMP